MRINKFLARATGLSRRAADQAIDANRVKVNRTVAMPGADIAGADQVTLDGKAVSLPQSTVTILMHKPAGYVCSRSGQGSQTVYDLLPAGLHHLKTVGRLDKDSSGLLLLTNDGSLANRLTHPRYAKEKIYEVTLDRELADADEHRTEAGVRLDDGPSALQLNGKGRNLTVAMQEGRNRQIRRTFEALGYTVVRLHRTNFGPYRLDKEIGPGAYRFVEPASD